MDKRYGLLGENIAYSLSPKLHKMYGDYSYELFDTKKSALPAFFKKREFDGINVTRPYKTECIKYLDALSPLAQATESVNTILNISGRLIGYNTDCAGFIASCEENNITFFGKTVVIFGSGGASRAVAYAAKYGGAKVVAIVSRNGELNYQNFEKNYGKTADYLINATPLGLHDGEILAVDFNKFKKLSLCIDLLYDPAKTEFLLNAERTGLKTVNGLYMLCYQGAKSAELFSNKGIGKGLVEKAYKTLTLTNMNIILTGMTGAGKTTVGKLVADKLGKRFFDTDEEIYKLYNKTSSEIIADSGEADFREKEKLVTASLSELRGAVIATGGGAMLNFESAKLLKKNGIVFFLSRKLKYCDFTDRPLIKLFGAENLYRERLPIYLGVSDHTIISDGNAEASAEKIIKTLT